MADKKRQLLNVWGDTVDFRQLLCGVTGGALLGYFSFAAGLRYLVKYHPSLQKGLAMGYALLFGVGGCVVAGVIAAKLFPPKHVYREQERSIDRSAVLQDLKVNMQLEAEYLKQASPKVIREMQALQLYDLFKGEDGTAATVSAQPEKAGQ